MRLQASGAQPTAGSSSPCRRAWQGPVNEPLHLSYTGCCISVTRAARPATAFQFSRKGADPGFRVPDRRGGGGNRTGRFASSATLVELPKRPLSRDSVLSGDNRCCPKLTAILCPAR